MVPCSMWVVLVVVEVRGWVVVVVCGWVVDIATQMQRPGYCTCYYSFFSPAATLKLSCNVFQFQKLSLI